MAYEEILTPFQVSGLRTQVIATFVWVLMSSQVSGVWTQVIAIFEEDLEPS